MEETHNLCTSAEKGGRQMRVFKQSITLLLAVGFGLAIAGSAAASDDVVTLVGDVGAAIDGSFAAGGPDIFKLKCSATTEICAGIVAGNDNVTAADSVYGVTVSCGPPSGTNVNTAIATTPGDFVVACIDNCRKAQITFFCDPSSPDCDDSYGADLGCCDASFSPCPSQRLVLKQLQDH